ncbi:MAG: hypothetical protein PHY77_01740 [Desulfotomaculaceae bacterium]|nr:hypothetical protein [Desulfotomaculaceae bacterium]
MTTSIGCQGDGVVDNIHETAPMRAHTCQGDGVVDNIHETAPMRAHMQ